MSNLIIIPRTKSSDVNSLVQEVTREYFRYLKDIKAQLNGKEISELFRYVMCRLLDLETVSVGDSLEPYALGCMSRLNKLIKKTNVGDKSIEFRQGMLEACVHGVEMARKVVD